MYVCLCKGVTDSQIRDAVNGGAESVRAVRDALGVTTGCGQCASLTRDIVADTLNGVDSSDSSLFFQVA